MKFIFLQSIIKNLSQLSKTIMFKKRGLIKPSLNNGGEQNVEKITDKKLITGIDLRKDIQEMENTIALKKQQKKYEKNPQLDHNRNDLEEQQQKQQNRSIFKTKKINKFTNHILKNLPTKSIERASERNILLDQAKVEIDEKKRQVQNIEGVSKQLIRPVLSNYGLLDKTHFKSHHNENQEQIQAGKGKDHQQALMDYYIKKKMEQINKKSNSLSQGNNYGNSSESHYNIHKKPEAWQEVLQIQKQYLTQQEKIKQYSVEEIQKKLQKLAQQTIKMELQKRTVYFKDLLQNEHQRMQYASKKELKMMRQQKQRIQKQLNSKYRQTGRRHFVESIKNGFL